MQVTTKDIKKEDTLYMNSPAPEALCAKGICQIQSPFSVVNFANNVSILHITWHNFWNLLSTNLNDKSFHDSIEWSGIYLQVNVPLRLGKTFRFSVFRLLENPFVKLPLSMIISPSIKNNTYNLPLKICLPMKSFFGNKVPPTHTLGGRRHDEGVIKNKTESKRYYLKLKCEW